jgi:hypothetical protein
MPLAEYFLFRVGLPDNGHNLQSVCECLEADGIRSTPRRRRRAPGSRRAIHPNQILILAGTTSQADTSPQNKTNDSGSLCHGSNPFEAASSS